MLERYRSDLSSKLKVGNYSNSSEDKRGSFESFCTPQDEGKFYLEVTSGLNSGEKKINIDIKSDNYKGNNNTEKLVNAIEAILKNEYPNGVKNLDIKVVKSTWVQDISSTNGHTIDKNERASI